MARTWNQIAALKAAGLPETLVSPSLASEITGYSLSTIHNWVKAGRIKAWGTPWGSRYLVDLTEILAPIVPSKPIGEIITREEWRKRRARGAAISAGIGRARMARARAASNTDTAPPPDPAP